MSQLKTTPVELCFVKGEKYTNMFIILPQTGQRIMVKMVFYNENVLKGLQQMIGINYPDGTLRAPYIPYVKKEEE